MSEKDERKGTSMTPVTWLLKSGPSSECGAGIEGGWDSKKPDAEQHLKTHSKWRSSDFSLSLFGLTLMVYNCLDVCLYLPHAPSVHLSYSLSVIPANWAKFSFVSANDHISHCPLLVGILALEMSIYLEPSNVQHLKFNCSSSSEGKKKLTLVCNSFNLWAVMS